MTNLTFPSTLAGALKSAELVLALVPEKQLKAGWLGESVAQPWCAILEKAAQQEEAGPAGKTLVMVNPGKGPERIVLGILPDEVSRHNCPARADAVYVAACAAGLLGKTAAVITCLDEEAHALPVARALARALPLYSRTSKKPGNGKKNAARKGKPKVAFFAMDRAGCAVVVLEAGPRGRGAQPLGGRARGHAHRGDDDRGLREGGAQGRPRPRARTRQGDHGPRAAREGPGRHPRRGPHRDGRAPPRPDRVPTAEGEAPHRPGRQGRRLRHRRSLAEADGEHERHEVRHGRGGRRRGRHAGARRSQGPDVGDLRRSPWPRTPSARRRTAPTTS